MKRTSTTYYSGTQVKHACVITMVITSVFWLAVLGVGKAEAPEEVVTEVYAAPLAYFHSATPPSNMAGWSMKDLTEDEFRTALDAAGFRNLDGMNLPMMRRLFLAWHYKSLYERVAKRTGIDESVIFAYFIIEATVEGVESKLWREHWNPGGIKYRGQADVTFHKDDCGGVPCAFESIPNFDEAVRIWSGVFNKPRYKNCKRRPIDDTCACLKKAGYYTGPGWKSRANVAKQYRAFIENHFPDNV